jgi:TM2 domain-containing membrane protein YozV
MTGYRSNGGTEIDEKYEISPSCSVRQEATKSPKSRKVAALLAMSLGGLGIHKFYLEKGRTGLLYLLFCWTYIPTIIAFIEGGQYLLMSDEDFAVEY